MQTSKNRKIFLAHNEQGSMTREKSGFQKNYEKNSTKKIFGPSHSRYVPIRTELPLPSSCC